MLKIVDKAIFLEEKCAVSTNCGMIVRKKSGG